VHAALFAIHNRSGGVYPVDEKYLHVTNKELFYSAMMLNFDRLVNVEYIFPADEDRLAKELDEVKRSLHKKKLLNENSKGEINLDFALSACTAFCANPDKCIVVDEEGYYATVYVVADSYMLLERGTEDENSALWFRYKESLDGYVMEKLESIKGSKKEAEVNVGT